MVRVIVVLQATSSRSAQGLLDALRFLQLSTRFDPGCLECSVWVESDGTVRCTELWASELDARRRVSSDHFTSLLSVMESARAATVQFDFVSSSRGLDYIQEVRGETTGP